MTAALLNDGSVAGRGDPNYCPACRAQQSLCDDHEARMRDDAAEAVALLAVMEYERTGELAAWRAILEAEEAA